MADARARRTGEHNPQIISLMADAAAMREQMAALEGRVLRLESELAAARANAGRATMPLAPRPTTKRPAPLVEAHRGPPPLPPTVITAAMPSMPPSRRSAGRRSIVDISEIAELVESIPPPPPRSKR